jgi:putative flavoprotein involved in K+ transport
MTSLYDVLVIGAGQSGLATGYFLRQTGLSFALCEAGPQPAGSWPKYYESLRLFSPARYASLPGLPFPGDPDAYPTRTEVATYLGQYAQHFQLPIILNMRVVKTWQEGGLFHLQDEAGQLLKARQLVVATGAFNDPHIPCLPHQDSFQGQIIHSAEYRNPKVFKDKRVVVVGAGNSAVQIAVELAQNTKTTITSRHPIAFQPQRLFQRDVHFWIKLTGLDNLPKKIGDLIRYDANVLDIGTYKAAVKAGHPDWRPLFKHFIPHGVVWQDGSHEAIDALIFATGYQPNLEFLRPLGAIDRYGQATQRKGISTHLPGLYYVGQSLQRTQASATLRGVGADAAYVVRHLHRQPLIKAEASATKPY